MFQLYISKLLGFWLQLRPVLIVFEFAPLTPRKLKDDNKTGEIKNLRKTISRVPKGGNFFERVQFFRVNYIRKRCNTLTEIVE